MSKPSGENETAHTSALEPDEAAANAIQVSEDGAMDVLLTINANGMLATTFGNSFRMCIHMIQMTLNDACDANYCHL